VTGRELPPSSPFAGDDGTADPAVAAALDALQDGSGTVAALVDALAGTRVLVPVLAELEVEDVVVHGGHEHTVDKEASAGIVALQAPDGRTALPVFTSVATMAAWRADARPVPSDVARAALSAVTEGWEVLVVIPAVPRRCSFRGPPSGPSRSRSGGDRRCPPRASTTRSATRSSPP